MNNHSAILGKTKYQKAVEAIEELSYREIVTLTRALTNSINNSCRAQGVPTLILAEPCQPDQVQTV